jgi:hypothetical protein
VQLAFSKVKGIKETLSEMKAFLKVCPRYLKSLSL